MEKELYKLTNIDPLDITDVIVKIENSFNLKFDENIFRDVKTFGEFCDVILGEIKLDDSESCTTQQAYYRLCNAISKAINLNRRYINPQTDLSNLIPRKNRRKIIALIDNELGFKTNLLQPKGWVVAIFILLFITSCIKCFSGWQIGLTGMILSVIAFRLANVFGKEIRIKTFGDLVRKVTKENYLKVRRYSESVNRKEIEQIINDLFTDQLDLEPKSLTRNTSFV